MTACFATAGVDQGGRSPEWSRESGELFYVNEDTLMASKVTLGNEISWSVPRPLFVSAEFRRFDLIGYAISADGQRILLTAENPDAPAR